MGNERKATQIQKPITIYPGEKRDQTIIIWKSYSGRQIFVGNERKAIQIKKPITSNDLVWVHKHTPGLIVTELRFCYHEISERDYGERKWCQRDFF